jgi:putative acetyltransferase
VTIVKESPLTPDLSLLMARHTADMHLDTPPESIHMMDASALAIPEVQFFVSRHAGEPVAMGAIKTIASRHAEIKSMHVLVEHRGRGLSKTMLHHLIAAAQASGIQRLSLETGTQDMFLPARRLYEKAGFEICAPFADYTDDPNSVFMTRTLA